MANQYSLPLAAMERLLKRAGADRVAEDAKAALRELLEDHALSLGEEANRLARHAGRKTIRAVDLKLARKVS